MASPHQSEGGPVIPGIHQLLLSVHRHYACPLFDLTKADTEWKWGPKEQSAFDILKGKVTSAPILVLPDNSKPFHIEADSSDFATGAVLSQQSPNDKKWHPIAFLSKSLSPVEHN